MNRPVPTIADCAREPIHLSGAIQPHGYLVSCVLPDWTIRHVSANVEALFDRAPMAMLGESLLDYLGDDLLQAVVDTVDLTQPGVSANRACVGNVGALATLCDLSVHVADGLVHLEIEPQPHQQQDRVPIALAQNMIARITDARGGDFLQRVAEQVRQLTGYDRVMVYRFRPDDAGEVVAETCAPEMPPYLGLRYPASDIPPQARGLYLRNRLRVIPDAGYTPVPVLPATTAAGQPLDFSQHVLRSVSPVHVEYLHNMGVAASMSISIVSGGRLWGLIACHHRKPRLVSAGTRVAAELFGLFVSMRVSAQEQDATAATYEQAQQLRDAIGQRLSEANDFRAALAEELPLIRATLGTDGASLWLDGHALGSGRVPADRAMPALRHWLAAAAGQNVVMTNVATDWQAGAAQDEGLAGVLGIRVGSGDDWLLLFRVEQVEDVRWAGEPHKALVGNDDGLRISPRKSFATWRETMRGRSVGWSDADRRGAERLHRVLREQRLRALARAEQLAGMDFDAQRQALTDHRQRLDDLAHLMEGLVHLDPDGIRAIDARIAALETELRRRMGASGTPGDA